MVNNKIANYDKISSQNMYHIMKALCDFGYRRAGTQITRDVEKYIYYKLIKQAKINFSLALF